MYDPHLVCVLDVSGDSIFRIDTFGHQLRKDDLFQYTVGGVTTSYKVEKSTLEVESREPSPEANSVPWITVVQRVVASIVP